MPPGQYHDIFRIYIEDIFQKNTTKPTIVLLQTNLIFQKKIPKKKFPKKKSQKKNLKKKVVSDAKYGFIRHTRSLKFQCGALRRAILYFDILTTIEIMTCSGFQISEEVYAYFYLYFCAKNVVKTICAYLMS